MKRILVVHYSQTGQLRRLAESVCAPLAADPQVELTWLALEPARPYPFPWPLLRFFDEFPEAVWLDPPALQPFDCGEGPYDLVILAYTVWFLSPCPPMTAFLKSAAGRKVLAGAPVVTLIGCRNMWLLAQEEVKKLLAAAGARHCDNIVLTDSRPSLGSFITTPRWMLTGKADGVLGLPRPGIYADDIAAASRFGRAIGAALAAGSLAPGQPMLQGLRAAVVDDRLIASERVGRRSFMIWGRLVRAIGPQGAWRRKPVLCVYVCFLIAMILTVVPLTLTLRALLRPLAAPRLARLKSGYEQPSGSGAERMTLFAER